MTEYLAQGTGINELLRESFRLNRSLVEAAATLTAGTAVTGAQWGVLASFGRNNQSGTVAGVARRMRMARQSVQRVADVLAEIGLIEYLPNPSDRRARLVSVTAKGHELLRELDVRQQKWLSIVVGDRNETDIERAAQLVKAISEEIRLQSVESSAPDVRRYAT